MKAAEVAPTHLRGVPTAQVEPTSFD